MTQSEHDRARELIALAGSGDEDNELASAQQAWLLAHLRECAACREYEDAAGRAVSALRSQPLAAGSALVRTTQMRVRARALELGRQRERFWLVFLSCSFVGISAAITTPLFWRAFAWMGAWAGVSNWVWQAGFAFFWIAPALVAGALLLGRGTHLAGSELTGAHLSGNGEQRWR
jgi:predicted anti-sigma-YlaC factor YlaD